MPFDIRLRGYVRKCAKTRMLRLEPRMLIVKETDRRTETCLKMCCI